MKPLFLKVSARLECQLTRPDAQNREMNKNGRENAEIGGMKFVAGEREEFSRKICPDSNSFTTSPTYGVTEMQTQNFSSRGQVL